MRSMPKTKLSYHFQSNRMQYVMKTKQDNNVIDHIGAIYNENNTNLHDWSNREQSIMKTRQDNDMIDCIGVVYA